MVTRLYENIDAAIEQMRATHLPYAVVTVNRAFDTDGKGHLVQAGEAELIDLFRSPHYRNVVEEFGVYDVMHDGSSSARISAEQVQSHVRTAFPDMPEESLSTEELHSLAIPLPRHLRKLQSLHWPDQEQVDRSAVNDQEYARVAASEIADTLRHATNDFGNLMELGLHCHVVTDSPVGSAAAKALFGVDVLLAPGKGYGILMGVQGEGEQRKIGVTYVGPEGEQAFAEYSHIFELAKLV